MLNFASNYKPMNKIATILLLPMAFIFVSCGNDDPEQNKTSVYEASFLDVEPGSSIDIITTKEPMIEYFKTFIPFKEEVEKDVVFWGSNTTYGHKTYRLEIKESVAKLTIDKEVQGTKKYNYRYTTNFKFVNGDYSDNSMSVPFRVVVTDTNLAVYRYESGDERYYGSAPNPFQYTEYGNEPWEEAFTENEKFSYDLTITKFSETKFDLFNDEYYFEFNPVTGLLIQTKPEYNNIGELNKLK